MTNTHSSIISVQLIHSLSGHTSDVNSVLFSPSHSRPSLLASSSSDKTIRLWNIDDQSSKTLTRHTYQVHCLAFAPESNNEEKETSMKTMASVSTDGTCLLWDLTTINVLKEYRHDSGSPIRVCQFSADGLLLATGKSFLFVMIIDATSLIIF